MKHPYLNYLLVETFRDCYATRFPFGVSAKKLMTQGCREIVKRHPSIPVMQQLSATTEQIQRALDERSGLSIVSMGDSEVLALALDVTINDAQFRDYLSAPARKKAGHTSDLRQDRKLLLQGLRQADLIGVPFMMHSELQPLTLKTLPHLLSSSQTYRYTDSAFGYLFASNGELARVLRDHPQVRILLVGNQAPALAKKMQDFNIVDCIAPINGLANVDDVLKNISRCSFDLALVAAGTASLPICGHIGRQLHRIAIDIGKLPDLLLGGWLNWLHPTPSWHFDLPPSRLAFMALWSRFMYDYFPTHASVPLGYSPGQILNAGIKCYKPETASYKTFVDHLNRAYSQKRSFVYLSSTPPGLLSSRHHFPKHTFIGVPLLEKKNADQSVNVLDDSHRLHFVDSHLFSFISSQFHPAWQRFLLTQKPPPRLLLIGSRRTKRWENDLKRHGVRAVDTVVIHAKRKLPSLYKQLQKRSDRFDVVIVSHDRYTVPICLFAANRLRKIAIDGRELEDIGLKDYIHRLFWEGRTFRPAKRWQDLARIATNPYLKNRSN